MRLNRYSFAALIGLVLLIGSSAVLAGTDDRGRKRPKGMGTLSIRTKKFRTPSRLMASTSA